MSIDNNDLISLITNTSPEFAELFAKANKIFKLQNAMPDQVFNEPYRKFFFASIGVALYTPFFDTCLKPLAKVSDDDTLILGVFSDVSNLENVPYFVKYPVSTSFKTFEESLCNDTVWEKTIDDDMNILHNFVWFSQSGLWAIWVSNAHGETAVLAFANDDMYHKSRHISDSWFTAYEALEDYMSGMFWGGVVPEKFSQLLIHNYGWLERHLSYKNLPLINNYEDFLPIWDQINRTFYIDKEYPDTIFKKPYADFVFEIFWWIIEWDVMLKRLAVLSGDDAIIIATIKPDPIKEFYPQQKNFNAVIMPLESTTHLDYWETVTAPQEKDSKYPGGLKKDADILAWTVTSGKWAIWQGNKSIIGFSDEDMFNKAKKILTTWLPL